MVQHVRAHQLRRHALQQQRQHRIPQLAIVHTGRRVALLYTDAEHLCLTPQGHAPHSAQPHLRLGRHLFACQGGGARPHLHHADQRGADTCQRTGRLAVGRTENATQNAPQGDGTTLPAQQGHRLDWLCQPELQHASGQCCGSAVEGWRTVSPQGAQQPLLFLPV